MIVIAVSIRDKVSEVFGQPFFVQNIGTAVRSFNDEINRESPDNMLNKHPDDFDLYEIGQFDDSNAELKPTLIRLICCGSDVHRKKGVN
jgi:hypothetical protein